jgi:peptidoglycan-associated lipoprotein
MYKRYLPVFILFISFALIMSGCPKKTVMKEEPSSSRAADLAAIERERAERERAEKEKAARLEAERRAKEKELREKEEAAKKEFEKSLIAKKTPGIEGIVYESSMLKDIHFDFDKYNIRPEDAEILKENAAILKKYPNLKIQIEGHCDERGTNEYNLALGERRANSAKNYLISLGISPDRLSTISYGEERPLDPGHNEEAWAKNRRAHFVIISK